MIDVPAAARELEARYPGPVRAEYVANPGGFVNVNFTVRGGGTALHVKLSAEPGRFDLWYSLRERLRREYRAPEVLERIELPGSGLRGLVFPHLEGAVPDARREATLLPEVVELAGRLHADRDLASRFPGAGSVTFHSCYETGIFECLSEDLVAVKEDPEVRSWVSPADLRFLEEEVENLRSRGREVLSDEPCGSALHGDLWLQNILVDGSEWFLLDWDEARIGDPAIDYTMLLREPWLEGRDLRSLLPDDRELRWRVDFLLRATSFDDIVDPLSDCTDTPDGLTEREAGWADRRRRSEDAFARYRQVYG